MTKETQDLLENLMTLNGVSGNEGAVSSFIYNECKKYLKDVKIDKMGNIIAVKKGKKPVMMFMAHMDEVGLMIKSIDAKGKMKISTIGGIDPYVLLGQRAAIDLGFDKYVEGVITINEILNNGNVPEKLKIEDLYIYTGMNKKELEKIGVKIGSYASFSQTFIFPSNGDKKDIIIGKALDDRAGCYVLLELIKNLKTKNEVAFVFTVQEEIGLYGAKASVFNLEPDYAIAVDVGGQNEEEDALVVGKGPVLTIKDAEMIGNQCLNGHLKQVAKKLKIPLQLEVSESGTTDATSVFSAKGGIPSTVLGVCVANLHTNKGIASRKDIEGVIEILKGFLKDTPDKCWR